MQSVKKFHEAISAEGMSKKMNNRPIGIFDSGVGGLTVLAKIKQALPGESIIYFGDTANIPYGGKSPAELLGYGQNIVRFLRKRDVKAVVMACGSTSSSVYEELLYENPDLPIVDVIRPGVYACIEMDLMRLGFIATAATIRSGLFAQLYKKSNPDSRILTRACPLFALMVEAGITHGSVANWAADVYVGQWKNKIDGLVFGCTHYPLLKDALSHVLGDEIKYIDLGVHTAEVLKSQLISTIGLSDGNPSYEYYVSGDAESFNKTARFLLQDSINAISVKL